MMQVVCLTLLLLALLCGCCIEGRPAISTRCNGKLKVAVSGSQRRRSVSSNEDALQITAAATTTAMPAARAASAGPSLMKINVLMLFFYMTLGATLPFLPLFYRRLGINDSGVGLLGAITPAITFLVSPIWGAIADSTKQYNAIMLATFVGSVAVRLGLTIIGKISPQSANDFTSPKMVWILAIISLSSVLNAPVKPIMDSELLKQLKNKSDYGKSRLYGQIGFGMGSFIVGPYLEHNINYIFYAHLLLAVPTVLLMMSSNNTKEIVEAPAAVSVIVSSRSRGKGGPLLQGEILRELVRTLSNTRVLVFFVVVFIIGVSSGIIENFAYVRISEVGGSRGNCLGVCRLVSSLAGGPIFYLSGAITNKIGINNVLSLSLLSYVLRFMNYAIINNPWQALPAEVLRGVTFGLFWSASTYYIYNESPKALTASMLSLLNGCYGGLGQSLGSLVGGSLSKRYGIPSTFLLCGLVDLGVLVLFSLFRLVNSGYDINKYSSRGKAGGEGGVADIKDKKKTRP